MFTTTNTGTPYQYIGTTPEGNLHGQSGTVTTATSSKQYPSILPERLDPDRPSPHSIGSPNPDSASTLTPAQKYASAHRRSLNSMTSIDSPRRISRQILEDEDLERDPSDLDGPRNMLPAEIPLFTKSRSLSHPAIPESTPPLVQGPTCSNTAFQESTRDPSPPIDLEHSGSHPSPSSNSRSTMGGAGAGYRVSDVSNIETCDSHTPLQPIAEVPSHSQAQSEAIRGHSGSSTPLQRSASGTGLKHVSDERMQTAHKNPTTPFKQPEWLHERPLPPHYPGLVYCRYCKIFKPHRTHHCRHCGTCVLAME
jgi:hypothetical protein